MVSEPQRFVADLFVIAHDPRGHDRRVVRILVEKVTDPLAHLALELQTRQFIDAVEEEHGPTGEQEELEELPVKAGEAKLHSSLAHDVLEQVEIATDLVRLLRSPRPALGG